MIFPSEHIPLKEQSADAYHHQGKPDDAVKHQCPQGPIQPNRGLPELVHR
jgi:hypothetical protein